LRHVEHLNNASIGGERFYAWGVVDRVMNSRDAQRVLNMWNCCATTLDLVAMLTGKKKPQKNIRGLNTHADPMRCRRPIKILNERYRFKQSGFSSDFLLRRAKACVHVLATNLFAELL
jgi:hypothetical protein